MSTDVQRRIDRACSFRFACACGALIDVFLIVVNLAGGSALVPAVLLVLFLALVVAETRVIRTLEQEQEQERERETGRPRMTLEDYRRLREMERELGWEPSDLPPELTPLPKGGVGEYIGGERTALHPAEAEAEREAALARAVAAQVVALSGTGSLPGTCTHPPDRRQHVSDVNRVIEYCGVCGRWVHVHTDDLRRQVIASQGILEAQLVTDKAAWDDVAYPSEASAHFAALARVGREHCLSYCPACLYRAFGPLADGFDGDPGVRQWLEKNWGWWQ